MKLMDVVKVVCVIVIFFSLMLLLTHFVGSQVNFQSHG